VSGFVDLTIRIHREGASYVADCLELDISSFGRTVEKAMQAVQDAVTTHLNSLAELGSEEVLGFLRSRGIDLAETLDTKNDLKARPAEVAYDEFTSRMKIAIPA